MTRTKIATATVCCSLLFGASALTLPSRADTREPAREIRSTSDLRTSCSLFRGSTLVRELQREERYSLPLEGQDILASQITRL